MPAVQALTCPQCGASIKNNSKTAKSGNHAHHLSECEYCGTALKIRADRPQKSEGSAKRDGRNQPKYDRSVKYRFSNHGLAHCPRCYHKLLPTHLKGGTLQSCKHCSGLWLPNAIIDNLHRRSGSSYRQLKRLNTKKFKGRSRPKLDLHDLVDCPECGDLMKRKAYRKSHPVVIDYCDNHGIWFDRNELVGAYQRSGRYKRQRRKKDDWWDDADSKFRRGWHSHALFAVIWIIVELLDEIFD